MTGEGGDFELYVSEEESVDRVVGAWAPLLGSALSCRKYVGISGIASKFKCYD